VILLALLTFLSVASVAILIWQWLLAMRFPLHRRAADTTFAPPITILKPLKGCDAETKACLASWLKQNYAGPTQILFGVASETDPVCEIVRQLIAENPNRDARLVICSESLGPNAKVSSLIQMERSAKHEMIIVSDGDVRVPPDFLANVVQPFKYDYKNARPHPGPLPQERVQLSNVAEVRESSGKYAVSISPKAGKISPSPGGEGERSTQTNPPQVGLVNCFYRFANPTTLAMQWEAIAVNADFWSQVLQSQDLKPLNFALGAVMATSRENLKAIGGFESLVEYLADDYQLGNRIAKTGKRIVISPVVVECWEAPKTWRDIWTHQLRWARTIRFCQPSPFFFSILSNATLWPLVLFTTLALTKNPFSAELRFQLIPLLIFLPVRMFAALKMQEKLSQKQDHYLYFWLIPVKDLLGAAIWALAFFGNTVEWRGEKFKVLEGGKLQKM
jgi:ceramide glucosyltransferase